MRNARVGLLILAVCLGLAGPARAQSITNVQPKLAQGLLTASDAGTCELSTAACIVMVPNGYTVFSVQLSGTWSATVQFESCILGCSSAAAWQPVLLTPPGATTPVSSVTAANGIWNGSTPANFFRVRTSAYTSGTISVAIFATLGPTPSSSVLAGGSGGTCATGATGDVQFTDGSNHCTVDTGVFHYTLGSHLLFVNNISSNVASALLLETQNQNANLTADPIHLYTGSIVCGACAQIFRGGEIDLNTGVSDATDGGSGNINITTGQNTNFPGGVTIEPGNANPGFGGGAINLISGNAGHGNILGGGTGGLMLIQGGQGGAQNGSPTAGPGGAIKIVAGEPGIGSGVQAVPGVIHLQMPNSSGTVITDCQATDAALSGSMSWSSACALVGSSTTNFSAALDAAFGSAQGGVIYRGASAWSFLAPGTSGNFLMTQGPAANPTWQAVTATGCSTTGTSILAGNGSSGCQNVTVGSGLSYSGTTLSLAGGGGGAWTLLEEHTAAGSTTLDFTTFYSSSYEEYRIVLDKVVPATTNVDLDVEVSTNGGSTYDTTTGHYAWAGQRVISSTSAQTGSGLIDLCVGVGMDNTAAIGLSGNLTLFETVPSTSQAAVSGQTMYVRSGSPTVTSLAGWYTQTGAAVNALRFVFTSGNVSTGTIRIYGLSK